MNEMHITLRFLFYLAHSLCIWSRIVIWLLETKKELTKWKVVLGTEKNVRQFSRYPASFLPNASECKKQSSALVLYLMHLLVLGLGHHLLTLYGSWPCSCQVIAIHPFGPRLPCETGILYRSGRKIMRCHRLPSRIKWIPKYPLGAHVEQQIHVASWQMWCDTGNMRVTARPARRFVESGPVANESSSLDG